MRNEANTQVSLAERQWVGSLERSGKGWPRTESSERVVWLGLQPHLRVALGGHWRRCGLFRSECGMSGGPRVDPWGTETFYLSTSLVPLWPQRGHRGARDVETWSGVYVLMEVKGGVNFKEGLGGTESVCSVCIPLVPPSWTSDSSFPHLLMLDPPSLSVTYSPRLPKLHEARYKKKPHRSSLPQQHEVCMGWTEVPSRGWECRQGMNEPFLCCVLLFPFIWPEPQ